MKYDCSLIPISRLVLSAKGLVLPLCNSCVTKDCTNPIQKMSISVFGVNKECRLYVVGANVMAVGGCEGYIGTQEKKTD